jgi:hypothetical protein
MSKEYLECIKDKGDQQECLDGFLEDLEDDLSIDGSSDISDLKNVEKRVKRIDEEDLEDCELLSDFVESLCDIGDDCCSTCNEVLSYVIDCLINGIIIPFVSIELNTTIPECPITNDCELEDSKRHRKAKQGGALMHKVLSMPKKKKDGQTKCDFKKEEIIKAADKNCVLKANVFEFTCHALFLLL